MKTRLQWSEESYLPDRTCTPVLNSFVLRCWTHLELPVHRGGAFWWCAPRGGQQILVQSQARADAASSWAKWPQCGPNETTSNSREMSPTPFRVQYDIRCSCSWPLLSLTRWGKRSLGGVPEKGERAIVLFHGYQHHFNAEDSQIYKSSPSLP